MSEPLSLLDLALQLTTSRWEIQRERQRLALVASVQEAMRHLPWEAMEHDDLPIVEVSPEQMEHEDLPVSEVTLEQTVRLFPLGQYRYVQLEDQKGRTTLYIGSDGNLYEYGPKHVSADDMDSPIEDNPIALRIVEIERLSSAKLIRCRYLLRRIWLT